VIGDRFALVEAHEQSDHLGLLVRYDASRRLSLVARARARPSRTRTTPPGAVPEGKDGRVGRRAARGDHLPGFLPSGTCRIDGHSRAAPGPAEVSVHRLPAAPREERVSCRQTQARRGFAKLRPVHPIISISKLSKTYATGQQALRNVDLEIRRGEIFGLLGPNGAGKTTLIGAVCGIVRPSAGSVSVGGHDIVREWRAARTLIGLVPQELTNNAFDSVLGTVRFSRGLFGKPPDPARLQQVLEELSLWERRDSRVMTLSGGMKRRMLIAKALAHDPQVLFLDEPTAGVDVELRQGMWQAVRRLREAGVTIILTTHYIEEAELVADRIGVINHGEIVVVDDKAALMQRLGRKQLTLELQAPLDALPPALAARGLALAAGGRELVYSYDAQAEASGIADLLGELEQTGVGFRDLRTTQSSLEDIFVDLVRQRR